MKHDLPVTAIDMFELRGWTFYQDDSNSEDDCMKIEYYAVNGGDVKRLDHSPYNSLEFEAAIAYMFLGFPPRRGSGAWTSATIIAAMKENLDDPN